MRFKIFTQFRVKMPNGLLGSLGIRLIGILRDGSKTGRVAAARQRQRESRGATGCFRARVPAVIHMSVFIIRIVYNCLLYNQHSTQSPCV